MSTQTLTEATLMAPVFNGSDEEVAQCTSSWSSIISSFSYACGSISSYGGTPMSAENKRAMYVALQCYLNTKVDELNNVTPPVPVATTPPAFVAPMPVPTEQPAAETEIEFASYAESKKPIVTESQKATLKRMRELAGIAHPENRV